MIFGGATLPTTIDLANLGTAGITIFGADAGDQSGRSVSSAGDVNGDGFDDLLIGAPNAAASGNAKTQAGESYVIFGGDFTSAITHLGTAAGETLTGTASANVMIGGRGNDTLIGGGGADVLTGGQGNDVLAVSDLTFKRLVGGTGSDTLRLDGSGLSLNLTTLRDNRILGIEQIDITGTGNNTLTLNQREVLNLSDESNTLLVQGNSLDRVLLDSGWIRGSDEIINAVTYRVLTQGAATLKVAAAISLLTSTIDLASLGTAGITIFGAEANDQGGRSVSNAGDVNGDGFDDLLIGAFTADASGNAKSNAGESYVIFGGAPLSTTIDLASLGTAGITLFGADAGDLSGYSVSSAGDVNGDGFDDLLIGAYRADASGNAKSYAGDSYVIFGGASLPTTIDLANLGTAGITIFGAGASDYSGRSVSAGDVNGDGFDDLLIGASFADASSNAKGSAGDSYVIFGGASLPTTIDLASLGTAGITIFGADAVDQSGRSVSSAGDVNGDGFDDLLIGAPTADASGNTKSNAGDSYVIFGGASLPTTIDLLSLSTAGITISGVDTGDSSGRSVSSAGDVNGDGFDDLLIGAYRAAASGNAKSDAGETYVIFGGASLPTTIDLASLGTAGITIFGAEVNDQSGRSVSSAGDVNGDGFDDLLIGAFRADASGNERTYAGDSYVIFGGALLPATIDLASLGTAGITIFGADASDYSGLSVSSAGDVNGDGFDDLLIGALLADASGNAKSNAGDSYVIFGGDFSGSVTHAGTANADTLTGTAAANVIIGGRGNDTLIGNGGEDVIYGGEGDDTIAISDLTFRRIDGGNGSDTLRLDGTGLSLNLTTLRDNRILGIEQIDITGTGNNTLTLNQREVLNLSDESNTLLVQGNSLDRVLLDGGWIRGSDEIINAVIYSVLTQGAAKLKVAAAISLLTSTIDLASLGTAGITIFGAEANDRSGFSVSSAGDVNGDGFDDLLIGAYGADASGNAKSNAGESYVIFGGPSLPATIDLATLGTAGITIFGAEVNDQSGRSVSSAGDVNGDGFDDLLIGASFADASGNAKSYAGDSYVIFGGASLPTTIDLASLGTAGITIFGADAADQSGRSVSSAGDVNGDGFDDLLIGAPTADATGNTKSYAGDSYVIFGGASLPTTIDLASLGTAGITIFGAEANDRSSQSVSSAGDVNGDGFDDLLVGAIFADASGNAKSDAGDSYVIFGGASLPTTIDLANLGTAGITLFGADAGDFSGSSVSSAGDVNGDGFDDLLIGSYRAEASGNTKSYAGESYVIFGGASLPTTIDLASLGTAGITLFGADVGDYSGRSVSSAGDVNGDGFDDLLIGSSSADASGNAKSNAGDSYVIFGGASLPTTIDLASLGTAGITIFGAGVGDNSGFSVSSAGDVNGDGFDDLLIGALLADASGNAKSNAGDSYVIFGGDFSGSVTHAGTASADTLTGTAAANVIIGGRGNDTLIGNGGEDVIYGGEGDDTIEISDLAFRRIDGGNGSDTLRLDGSGLALNLTSLADNKLTSLETIDIRGSGPNSLTLNFREVLNLTGNSNPEHSVHTLTVRRDSDDTVNMGINWIPGSHTTINGISYQIFTQGTATLRVEDASPVNHPPTDIALSSSSIVENAGGNAVVGTLTASDPDAGDSFTFTLPAGVDDNSAFNISGNSLRANASFNFEATSSYTVTVRVTDAPGLSFDKQFTISVTDVAEVTYSVTGGLLTVTGTVLDDDITVLNDAGAIRISANGTTLNPGMAAATLTAVSVAGLGGNDTMVIDSTLGAAVLGTLLGGDGNDVLLGGAGNDTIDGGAGNDSLFGGLGNDLFVFGTALLAEADTVSEGTNQGSDTLSFASLTTGVTLNLNSSLVQAVHANRTLKLNAGGTFENIVGGSGNDRLTGNSLNNTLNGYDGDDVLSGGDGNDTLVGGAGNETYVFNTNTPLGSDTVTDSAGSDYLYFVGSTNNLTVNLGLTTPQVVNANLTLTLASATSIEHIYGGSRNDTLTGNSLNNTLNGYDGDDVLSGGDGNDTLNAGGGNDTLNAGAGNDKLYGGAGADVLDGGDGNDTLYGESGNDTLVGGAGNETYVFNTNTPLDSDTVTDSAGNDYLYFVGSTNNVTVNISLTTSQVVNANLTLTLASATSIEHIYGGSGNDTLTGNSLNNTLNGYDGDDVLSGGDGNDTLNAGAGNDTLVGGAGNETYVFNTNTPLGSDTVTDSAGSDYLYFVGSTNNVTVNLSLTTPQVVNANLTLTLASATSIEHIFGGSGNDTLTGNSLNNTLNGYDGDDVLSGGDGNDTLNAGAGNDKLYGGAGADVLDGGDGNDTLYGESGNDTLVGGAGNETYVFNTNTPLGSDTVTDSAGSDYLYFVGSTNDLTVNLGLTTPQVVNANLTLTLASATSIEHIYGGSGNDTLIGNSLNNTLNGYDGNDVLSGGDGNDTLNGGGGKNILIGGNGADGLTGGSSEDLLLGAWYSLENSTTALAALFSEWTSGSAYADRVAHLLGTLAGGANGSFTLTSTTVKEDNAKDTLTGGSVKDWYLRNSLGATPANRDTTTDIDIDSVFTEIDTWL